MQHYRFVVKKGVGIVVKLDCPIPKSEILLLVVVDPYDTRLNIAAI